MGPAGWDPRERFKKYIAERCAVFFRRRSSHSRGGGRDLSERGPLLMGPNYLVTRYRIEEEMRRE